MTEENINIAKDTVVTFHYTLKDAAGTELENSRGSNASKSITGGEPVLYLHGYKGMMAGIEAGLESKSAGETASVTLGPDDAYGRYDEKSKGRVPLKNVKLPGQQTIKGKLKPGTVVEVQTKQGPREATVIKQGLKSVDIDTNHPYVEMTLTFNMEVVAVRAATDDEKQHGHAHAASSSCCDTNTKNNCCD
jgi:FKBP-type peptidyl-prolyl cis-trans isomerase SlyD|tara:strand:- start:935 stop:1507 length:573 start_codon:yes stop_codon:yes gene_type:complete